MSESAARKLPNGGALSFSYWFIDASERHKIGCLLCYFDWSAQKRRVCGCAREYAGTRMRTHTYGWDATRLRMRWQGKPATPGRMLRFRRWGSMPAMPHTCTAMRACHALEVVGVHHGTDGRTHSRLSARPTRPPVRPPAHACPPARPPACTHAWLWPHAGSGWCLGHSKSGARQRRR